MLALLTEHLKDISGVSVTFVHNFEVHRSLAVDI